MSSGNEYIPNINPNQKNIPGLARAFKSTSGRMQRIRKGNIISFKYLDQYNKPASNELKCTYNTKTNSTTYSYFTSDENAIVIQVTAYDDDSDGTIDRYTTIDELGDTTSVNLKKNLWNPLNWFD